MCNSSLIERIYETKKIPEKQSICNNCGLVFKSTRMSGEELKNYYLSNCFSLEHRGSIIPDIKIIEKSKKRGKSRFDLITKHIGLETVLDIGCGAGGFLRVLQEKGIKCIGIDPSSGFTNWNNSNGLRVYLGNFPENLPKIGKVNCITAFHVIEHTENPVVFLENCWKFLEDYGFLVLEYPDILQYFKHRKSPTFNYFHNRSHLFDFSFPIIEKLLKVTGFKVLFSASRKGESISSDKNMIVLAQKTKPQEIEFVDSLLVLKTKSLIKVKYI